MGAKELSIKEYRNIHNWIRIRKINIKVCEFCGCNDKKLDNALKINYKHEKNINNYIKLCRKCHIKYDFPDGKKHTEEIKKKIGISSSKRIKEKGVSDNFINSRKNTKISDNHKLAISRSMQGDNHHQSKLTTDNVIYIRKNKNISSKDLAKEFNVTYESINNIRTGKTWRNLL